MGRFILRRILIIPPALLLINFLAYTYAYLVAATLVRTVDPRLRAV
jgi:hypothetical protein